MACDALLYPIRHDKSDASHLKGPPAGASPASLSSTQSSSDVATTSFPRFNRARLVSGSPSTTFEAAWLWLPAQHRCPKRK